MGQEKGRQGLTAAFEVELEMSELREAEQLRLEWDKEEQLRRHERFEWEKEREKREKERFNWDQDRYFSDKCYREREQKRAWFSRHPNIVLHLTTLTMLFVYPLVREQYFLENRIEKTVTESLKKEFESFRIVVANPPTPSFTVGPFKVSGPDGSTSDNLINAIFKTAAEKGPKTLDDTLKTAIHAVELGDKSFSLAIKVSDKVSGLIRWLRTNPDNPNVNVAVEIFDQVMFENDRYDLSEPAKASLNKIATYLKSELGKSDRILVEGHASATGSAQHNLSLSRERALRVKTYLVDRGVGEERIFFYGFGQGYLWLPFLPDHPDNRRARITICNGGEGGTDRCPPQSDDVKPDLRAELRVEN